MSVLAINPGDGAYAVSPTTPIVVIGVSPGGAFNLSTLSVQVGGEAAVLGGEVLRPQFSGAINSTGTTFVLTLTARRAFLYRVKVLVEVSVLIGASPYALSAEFETADRGEDPHTGALRNYLNGAFFLPEPVAISAVAQQLFSLLGGSTQGAFALRLARCIYRSQLYSTLKVLHPKLDASLGRLLENGVERVSGDDATVPASLAQTLTMVDVFWEPAVHQLVGQGMDTAYATMLNRVYRSENLMERLGAAAALVWYSWLGERNPALFATLFSTDQV